MMQQLLYASNRYALLLIFQAMDAAGKDGAIKHVMSGVNPQGCQVFSYRHPSATELHHDFLWRTTRDLPERGRIGIFNRSYYEEVLIVRVHPEILRSEGIAGGSLDAKTVWESRFRSIVGLERHLHLNGTRIVKFYLHLSKDEQRKRFLQRIDEPKKHWKFSLADVEERKVWKGYMSAYVCRPRRRQGERPVDRFADHPRYAQWTGNGVSRSECQTAEGDTIDPGTVDKWRSGLNSLRW